MINRTKTHGKFYDNALISQGIKLVMRSHFGWNKLNSEQREALEYIAGKISRIIAGDPNFKDHWDDIIGYAGRANDENKNADKL
jgi:hypothetical protein